jgi:hypothetical protein
MEDDIVRKLRSELERGISTEAQAAYLLVKTRKLMDLDEGKGTEPNYDMLRLCCNWVVHVELSGGNAQQIVRMADTYYPKLLEGKLTEEEKQEFRKVFSLEKFREELNLFLHNKKLPPLSGTGWHAFEACFLNTIEDCPLVCKSKEKSNHVDEVVLIKQVGEEDRVPDGSAPAILWELCFQKKPRLTIGANFTLSDKVVDAMVEFDRRRGRAA